MSMKIFILTITISILPSLHINLISAEDMSEPKSILELRELNRSIVTSHDEPFVFILPRDNSLYLDKKKVWETSGWEQEPLGSKQPCNVYRLKKQARWGLDWVYVEHYRSFAKTFIKGGKREIWTYPSINPYMLPQAATYPPPFSLETPRVFYNFSCNGENVGIFSRGHRLWGFEKHAVYSITFFRGNTEVTAFTKDQPVQLNNDEKFFQSLEIPFDPDPCEVAWRIDKYLKGDPLENVNDEEKQNLKTLKITLPKDTEFEQGKEYPLDFPRKSPDGTVPAEIRLVVSRGEIQQIIETNVTEGTTTFPNPALLAPDIDGKYTVLFGQPEKQTVHCYHINEEGKCLAWGEIEVSVKKTNEQQKQEE